MALMYKLHKMQRTLKDGRTDTSNGKWNGRFCGLFHTDVEFFHTDNRGASRTNVTLGKLKNAVESTNKKKKTVMLSDNPCEFAS